MSSKQFGELVRAGMARKDLGQGKLAVHIGVLPDGRTLDATQIRLILQGKRRHLDAMLVQRIAEVLDLDPAEAHYLAGTWPPGLTRDQVRELGLFGNRRRSDRQLESVPAPPAAVLRGPDVLAGDCTEAGRVGLAAVAA